MVVDLEQAVGALDDLHGGLDARRLERGVGDLVDRDPGAISTHSDAWNGTGKKPRAVLPMNVACCGWSASRKQYVRSTVGHPLGGHANTRVSQIQSQCRDRRRMRRTHVARCEPKTHVP